MLSKIILCGLIFSSRQSNGVQCRHLSNHRQRRQERETTWNEFRVSCAIQLLFQVAQWCHHIEPRWMSQKSLTETRRLEARISSHAPLIDTALGFGLCRWTGGFQFSPRLIGFSLERSLKQAGQIFMCDWLRDVCRFTKTNKAYL